MMNMNRIRNIQAIILLLATALLAACTQDELSTQGELLPEGKYPLELTASIGGAAAAPATRSTMNGQWPDGGTVYVQISEDESALTNAQPLRYTVDNTGNLTLKEGQTPVYWERTDQTFYIRAWYPGTRTDYTDIPAVNGTWTAKTEGSPEQNDFLYAEGQASGGNSVSLEFRHLMAWVIVNLQSSPYLEEHKDDISVTLKGGNDTPILIQQQFIQDNEKGFTLSGEVTGNMKTSLSIDFTRTDPAGYSFEAMFVPQPATARNYSMEVRVGDAIYAATFQQLNTPFSSISFMSDRKYTYNITVDAKGLSVNGVQNISWTTGNTGSGSVTVQ